MEIKAYHAGIRGTIKVGTKFITFTDRSGTFKIAEITKKEDGQYSVYGGMKTVEYADRNEAVSLWLEKAGYKLITCEFGQIWETRYICERVNRIAKAVEDGNFESALDYLQMIKEKASAAEYFLKRKIMPTIQ